MGGLDVVFVLFIEYLPFQEDTTRARCLQRRFFAHIACQSATHVL